MRFVNQQNRLAPLAVVFQQEMVQCVGKVFSTPAVDNVTHPQLVADGRQQFRRAGHGVEDNRNIGIGRHLLQQTANDGGFAGADLSGQHHKAADLDAVQQMRKGFPVLITHI